MSHLAVERRTEEKYSLKHLLPHLQEFLMKILTTPNRQGSIYYLPMTVLVSRLSKNQKTYNRVSIAPGKSSFL